MRGLVDGLLLGEVGAQVDPSAAQILRDHNLDHPVRGAVLHLRLLRGFLHQTKIEEKRPVLTFSHTRNIRHTTPRKQYIAYLLDSQLDSQYIA